MINFLVGIHAFLGEIGILAFLWVFIEIIHPTYDRVQRAKKAAVFGLVFLFLSWFVGGFYYVSTYGANVKSVIKAGPDPWTHEVMMETKEHIFLFLPFLAFLVAGMLYQYKVDSAMSSERHRAILAVCAIIVIIGFIIAGMGYMVSSGFRSALEARVL